jgi:hypothetical protein
VVVVAVTWNPKRMVMAVLAVLAVVMVVAMVMGNLQLMVAVAVGVVHRPHPQLDRQHTQEDHTVEWSC